MRNFNLSGIGLGLYLLGLGITYILHQTTGSDISAVWLRLYPFLTILFGLDYILANINRTSGFFAQPGSLITAIIIIITIVGFGLSITPKLAWNDFQKFHRFGADHAPFDWEHNPQATLNEDFKLPAGVSTVNVENRFGNINIDTVSGDTISAKAFIRFPPHFNKHGSDYSREGFKLIGKVQKGNFVVTLEKPGGLSEFRRGLATDITLQVPRGLSVIVRNSAGNVIAGTVEGDLNIETSAGDVRVQTVGQNLTLASKFGNVHIGTVFGNADIITRAGRITVEKINGNSRIESAFGEVTLEECRGPVTAVVQTGNLKVNLAKINGNYDFNCKMGNIELGLPADAKFSLAANCQMGNIDTDFPVALKKEFASTSAEGNINGGGPLMNIRAKTGNIEIRKL